MNGSPIEQFTRLHRVVEERAPLAQRVARERRVDVIAFEVLAVVPLAVDARRLDVADAMQVDAEAGRRRIERRPAVEKLARIGQRVVLLPADGRVALGILMEPRPRICSASVRNRSGSARAGTACSPSASRRATSAGTFDGARRPAARERQCFERRPSAARRASARGRRTPSGPVFQIPAPESASNSMTRALTHPAEDSAAVVLLLVEARAKRHIDRRGQKEGHRTHGVGLNYAEQGHRLVCLGSVTGPAAVVD